jgi:uncharacterized membrane protein YphA (DoxX/SURF4 family)
MGGARASLQASAVATVWMLIWRLLYGGGCIIDGLSKLGLAFTGPISRATPPFQPSPLGPASAILELAFGALLLVGIEARVSVIVLAAHVGLGMLVAAVRHQHVTFEADGILTSLVLVFVLVFGPGWLSVDALVPDLQLFRRIVRKLRRQPAA